MENKCDMKTKSERCGVCREDVDTSFTATSTAVFKKIGSNDTFTTEEVISKDYSDYGIRKIRTEVETKIKVNKKTTIKTTIIVKSMRCPGCTYAVCSRIECHGQDSLSKLNGYCSLCTIRDGKCKFCRHNPHWKSSCHWCHQTVCSQYSGCDPNRPFVSGPITTEWCGMASMTCHYCPNVTCYSCREHQAFGWHEGLYDSNYQKWHINVCEDCIRNKVYRRTPTMDDRMLKIRGDLEMEWTQGWQASNGKSFDESKLNK